MKSKSDDEGPESQFEGRPALWVVSSPSSPVTGLTCCCEAWPDLRLAYTYYVTAAAGILHIPSPVRVSDDLCIDSVGSEVFLCSWPSVKIHVVQGLCFYSVVDHGHQTCAAQLQFPSFKKQKSQAWGWDEVRGLLMHLRAAAICILLCETGSCSAEVSRYTSVWPCLIEPTWGCL